MGVIQYRRGERFDRVITGKEGLFPDKGHTAIRLNVMTVPVRHGATAAKGAPVPGTQPANPLPPNDIRSIIRNALEEARAETQQAVKDVNIPKMGRRPDAPSASDEEEPQKKMNFWTYAVIAFVVFQFIRALAS